MEDESLVSEDIATRLETLGYEVCGQCDTCQLAIDAASSLQPDLILMDIHLIGAEDGVHAALEIRKSNGIPVVFLTAHADDGTLARISKVEPFGYILKPFDERELKATIEVALHRFASEARLKKVQHWLKTTLGGAGDGVITTDSEDNVNFINETAQKITDLSGDWAIGKKLTEILLLENDGKPVAIADLLDQSLNYVLPNQIYTLKTKRQLLPIRISISTMRDDSSTHLGWVITFCELSIQDANGEPVKSDKESSREIQSLNQPESSLTEQFNNLLQIIVSNAEGMRENLKRKLGELGADLESQLAEINSAAVKCQSLCNQKSDQPKKVQSALKELDLNQVVRETISNPDLSSRKTIKLSFREAEGLRIMGDEPQIKQLIVNLVNNAYEALEGSYGHVTLSVSSLFADNIFLGKCRIGNDLPEGKYIMLRVTDNGCGISPDILLRIFDPFFTTKSSRQGFGLVAVTEIIRLHAAALHVESVMGLGSSFSVCFPAGVRRS